ncbi:hypothetical protein BN1723_015545 [Verticillium longisporum]|uniref:Uncharacterized protein n=1 Tax=Verticillium longisporum TaxID=100787 RepID=A0A0G4MZX4_VERLO|nr:hypothetical protein BN1723_015545 [Verticillium longisporum]
MGKRQEVRSGGFLQLAHPDVLAARQMSRPRTPTPSQRSSVQRERHPSSEIQPQEQSQSQSQYSPKRSSQLANGSMERNESTETDRKPSIKTQDFVEQAGAIMAMIRSGIKPPNGLDSVEESEEGDYASPSPDIQDVSFEESTREPLSRPPSRDGKPVTRVPPRQENPEVLDYLKKYQELSDMGDVISSSLRSMGLAQDAIRAAQEVEKMVQAGQDVSYPDDLDSLEDIISDPPNIRISRGPAKRLPSHVSSSASSIIAADDKSLTSFPSLSPESPKPVRPFADQESNTYAGVPRTASGAVSVAESDAPLSLPDDTLTEVDVTAAPPALPARPSQSARSALFEDSPIASQKIPGALHTADDEHLDRLVKRHGAKELVRMIATDLAQRDAQIALLRRKADERERALRKIILECGLSNLELETKLRAVETENKASRPGNHRAESGLSDLMSDAMQDTVTQNVYGQTDTEGTIRATSLSLAPQAWTPG